MIQKAFKRIGKSKISENEEQKLRFVLTRVDWQSRRSGSIVSDHGSGRDVSGKMDWSENALIG